MRIKSVEAFAIKAPHADSKGYWGSRTWSNPKSSVSTAQTAGISAVETYPAPWRMKAIYSETIDCVIVRVTADDGTVGWGEAKAPVAPEATKTIIEQLLAPVIIGQDPTQVGVLWERMYSGMRLRGHLSGFYLEAISGIDIALYDLAGKMLGVPVYKLLGGAYRDKIPVYASGLPGLRSIGDQAAEEALQAEALQMVERGYNAIKIGGGLGIRNDLHTVEKVREAVGPDITLYLDAGGTYDLPTAGRLGKSLEDLEIGFFEAPVPPEKVIDYGRLASELDIPIATDLVTSRHQALEYFRHGGLDLVQPDVCRAGGITECRRIGELADVYGAAFAPHVSIGSAIHFAASAHLAASVPNLPVMEYWWGQNPLGSSILSHTYEQSNGFLPVPTEPGLGIDVREDEVLKYAVK